MSGAALVAVHTRVWSQAACSLLGSPTLTEGPYFVDEDLNRSDIRIDPVDGSMQPGVPLSLAINVSQKVDCGTAPFTGAYVDLRGFQPTDRQGECVFYDHLPGLVSGAGGAYSREGSRVHGGE
jgi:hypothetical protein